MLGAIVGDIVGSVYEWNNIKTKDFPLFRDDCFFTDDTVMTIATADTLMNSGKRDDFIDAYKKWGRRYPNAGYGSRFGVWIHSDDRKPYNSWGNGSAMRVSPVGFFISVGLPKHNAMAPLMSLHSLAEWSAGVTHNHHEGIKGASIVAESIWLIRLWRSQSSDIEICKSRLRGSIERNIERGWGYDLSQTLDEIRPTYKFNESCQETVPQAIIAFLESTDFEDAIRNAISLGGDSDTLAAITGSIAEAAYGIPEWIQDKALGYLDAPLREVYERWVEFTSDIGRKHFPS
jgi:ADP-ribosylglycohydrolase